MAKAIEILTFNQVGENAFEATGTCDGQEFLSRTILWGPKGNKEPIFKVVEDNTTAKSLANSTFNRGQRIAIARYLKIRRLQESEDLSELSVKELRAKCKERGVAGYWSKGVRKADLINLLKGGE